MTERLGELVQRYKDIGAELEYALHDPNHLDCLWYGGEVAWLHFPNGWKLIVEANGEIRIDCEVDGKEVCFVDKNNSGSAYEELGKDFDDSDIDKFVYGNNNWFEVNAISPNGEFIDLFNADNVLGDNILDALEDLTRYYDWAVTEDKIRNHD